MQLFGLFTSRLVDDELNIFSGLSKDYIFWAVFVFTSGIQVLLVEVGFRAINCYYSVIIIFLMKGFNRYLMGNDICFCIWRSDSNILDEINPCLECKL